MCEYNVIVSVKEGGSILKFNCSNGKCSVILQDLRPEQGVSENYLQSI